MHALRVDLQTVGINSLRFNGVSLAHPSNRAMSAALIFVIFLVLVVAGLLGKLPGTREKSLPPGEWSEHEPQNARGLIAHGYLYRSSVSPSHRQPSPAPFNRRPPQVCHPKPYSKEK